MNKKYTEKFKKVEELLSEINHESVKENDEDAKDLSCYLLEIIDEHK